MSSRHVAVAAAGALALVAALLPWVSAPLGFRQLQERGIDSAYGVLVLVLGLTLLIETGLVAVRRRGLLGRWSLLVIAAALALLASLGQLEARDVLADEVQGVGVHPGQRGPGLVVLWFAVFAGAVAALLAFREGGSAPGAGSAKRDGADDE